MGSRKHNAVESFIIEKEKKNFLYPICNIYFLIFCNKIKGECGLTAGSGDLARNNRVMLGKFIHLAVNTYIHRHGPGNGQHTGKSVVSKMVSSCHPGTTD